MKFTTKLRSAVLLFSVVCVTGSNVVFAAPSAPEWIGGVDSATITSDNEMDTVARCRNQEIEVVLLNRGTNDPFTQHVTSCVVEGDGIDVALYYSANGGRYGTAVRPQGDNYFRHLLTGTVRVEYTAEGDTLVFNDSYYGTQMTVVRNLSSNITAANFDNLGRATAYEVRSEAMKMQLPRIDVPGAFHSVYSHAISDNGRYIVAYVDYAGFVRIDLDTGEEKAVYTAGGAWYNGIYNPTAMAISNDGRFILTGPDVRVIDTNDCGWTFTGEFGWWHSNCNAEYYGEKVSNNVGYGFRTSVGKFIDDGYGFEIEVAPFPPGTSIQHGDGLAKHVTVKAGNYVAPTRLEYLALGDSYSSGEGDIGDLHINPYINDTDGERGCHISYRSYPYILKDIWNIDATKMRSVACSGAKVLPDYYGSSSYFGQHGQLLSATEDERLKKKEEAKDNFSPGILRQIDFVKTYKPKKLTFTGGGNDVGFADLLYYCASSYKMLGFLPINETCGYAYENSQMRFDLNRTIDDQYTYNRQFIEKIREVSPETEVYMIGYPQFISKSSLFCDSSSIILNVAERRMIHDSVSRLNNILKKVAQDVGVYFVDIEDSLAGGKICEGSLYMSGPVKVGLKKLSVRDSNMYHPNSRGHKRMADAIAQKIDNGMHYETIDIPMETNGRRVVNMAVLPSYAGIGSNYTIDMGPGIFGPDRQVNIEMFSDSIQLGHVTTESDGSFRTQVVIPGDASVGVHLISLSGANDSGDLIAVQQFIDVVSGIIDDADGDGIPDKDDVCFSITEWFEHGKNVCQVLNANKLENAEKIFEEPMERKSSMLLMGSSNAGLSSLLEDRVIVEREGSSLDTESQTYNTIDKNSSSMVWFILSVATLIGLGVFVYNASKKISAK